MSRIGKKIIIVPAGVEMKLEGRNLSIKGPKGQLERVLPGGVNLELKDGQISVSMAGDDKASRSMWGTIRMHVSNMVEGVSDGFSKKLQIEGIGYRASVEGDTLVLQVGFSHPVRITADKDIKFAVEKNIVTISGIDKDKVSKVAAETKRVRPPEPYKGKGIRYFGEIVRKKVGKKTVSGAGGK